MWWWCVLPCSHWYNQYFMFVQSIWFCYLLSLQRLCIVSFVNKCVVMLFFCWQINIRVKVLNIYELNVWSWRHEIASNLCVCVHITIVIVLFCLKVQVFVSVKLEWLSHHKLVLSQGWGLFNVHIQIWSYFAFLHVFCMFSSYDHNALNTCNV